MRRTHRKLTAVMFTDIVGYSAMVHADEAKAQQLLEWQRGMLRRHLRAYRGKHIDSAGDGNLAVFDSALHALECAIAIQGELAARNASGTQPPLTLRIGVHQGDVEHGNGR